MASETKVCPACGYDVTGLSSSMCPECGVDLAEAWAEFHDDATWWVRLMLGTLAAHALLVWGITLIFVLNPGSVSAGIAVLIAAISTFGWIVVRLARARARKRWRLVFGLFLASLAPYLLCGALAGFLAIR